MSKKSGWCEPPLLLKCATRHLVGKKYEKWDHRNSSSLAPLIHQKNKHPRSRSTWMSRWKLGSMVSRWVYNLLINGVYWGRKRIYETLILTYK